MQKRAMMKERSPRSLLATKFSSIVIDYEHMLLKKSLEFKENLKEQFNSFAARKPGANLPKNLLIKSLGNYLFNLPSFPLNSLDDELYKRDLIKWINFIQDIPGMIMPHRHHIIDKWLPSGIKRDSLYEILIDHGCEGSCPACRIGEVEHHQCGRCHSEFCPKCHGIVSYHYFEYIKNCRCKKEE